MSFAEIEQELQAHRAEMARLRSEAIRTPEARKMGGAEARDWLEKYGASTKEATAEIVAVLNERRAANGAPPVGTCSRTGER